MERSGAEIVIELLQRQGVPWIAGMPGGAALPLYDAIARLGLDHVLVRHEQAAGFMAQGYARVTGRAGVCLATSGPGATNLLTSVADAQRDSVPLVAITGQVPQALLGTDAFQEIDTPSLCRSSVKHCVQVRSARQLLEVVPQAFAIAEGGRPGAVWLDIPKDVQQERVEFERWPGAGRAQPRKAPEAAGLEALCARMDGAVRPLLMIGGGLNSERGQRALSALLARAPMPVASTLLGLGLLSPRHELSLGMLGMHGAPYTNLLLREADLVIALGVRFDDRATGKLSEFCPDAAIAHVDIDPRELGKLRLPELPLLGDAPAALEWLAAHAPRRQRPRWLARLAQLKAERPMPPPPRRDLTCGPSLIARLGAMWPAERIVTTDVGQHQMWVAQHFAFERPRSLLTSGGLGTMGFGLPAAIGAAMAADAPVLCISGDGSLLINVQELATLAELQLPVKILVLDNGHLGLVRQQQALFYDDRPSAARFERPTDFVALAKAFGLPAMRLEAGASGQDQLANALRQPGPCLIHAPIEAHDHVRPMVPPGAGNHQMLLMQNEATLLDAPLEPRA